MLKVLSVTVLAGCCSKEEEEEEEREAHPAATLSKAQREVRGCNGTSLGVDLHLCRGKSPTPNLEPSFGEVLKGGS